MQVTALDGRSIEVGRRWVPWRWRLPGLAALRAANPLAGTTRSRDVEAVVFDVVLGTIRGLVIGGSVLVGVVLLAVQALLLVLVVPVLAVLRLVRVLPWVVEARHGSSILGAAKVRGWRDSEELIRQIAADLQFGRDPFAPRQASAAQASSLAQPITRSW